MGNNFNTRIEGTRIKHSMGPVSIKMYDKLDLVLRIETTVNNVSFFKHYRKVEHRDGTESRKLAPMKKGIYSLTPLRDLLSAANHRYLQFISAIDDMTAAVKKVNKLSHRIVKNLKFSGNILCRHPHKGGHERINHRFARNRAKYCKIIIHCCLRHQPSDIGKGEMAATFDSVSSAWSFLQPAGINPSQGSLNCPQKIGGLGRGKRQNDSEQGVYEPWSPLFRFSGLGKFLFEFTEQLM